MGDRLRAARDAADLSVRQVAEAAHMSTTAAWSWEKHGYLPPPRAVRAVLADLYDIDEADLFAEVAVHLDAAPRLTTAE